MIWVQMYFLMCGTVKVGNWSIKKFCELRNNQTSPGLRGIEGLILIITETVFSGYSKGGCTLWKLVKYFC